MNKWIPIASAIVLLLLLYPAYPRLVTGIVGIVLVVLLVNKWPAIQSLFGGYASNYTGGNIKTPLKSYSGGR